MIRSVPYTVWNVGSSDGIFSRCTLMGVGISGWHSGDLAGPVAAPRCLYSPPRPPLCMGGGGTPFSQDHGMRGLLYTCRRILSLPAALHLGTEDGVGSSLSLLPCPTPLACCLGDGQFSLPEVTRGQPPRAKKRLKKRLNVPRYTRLPQTSWPLA